MLDHPAVRQRGTLLELGELHVVLLAKAHVGLRKTAVADEVSKELDLVFRQRHGRTEGRQTFGNGDQITRRNRFQRRPSMHLNRVEAFAPAHHPICRPKRMLAVADNPASAFSRDRKNRLDGIELGAGGNRPDFFFGDGKQREVGPDKFSGPNPSAIGKVQVFGGRDALAETGRAIQKQRIVGGAGGLGDIDRAGMGEAVGLADDEVVERVAGDERGGGQLQRKRVAAHFRPSAAAPAIENGLRRRRGQRKLCGRRRLAVLARQRRRERGGLLQGQRLLAQEGLNVGRRDDKADLNVGGIEVLP